MALRTCSSPTAPSAPQSGCPPHLPLAHPRRTAQRKDLFRLLYSDDTPRDADAFRQLLASLRKTLPGVFVTNSDSIALTADLHSDRRQFLDAVHRGDHESAVVLYAREFFEDFAEHGCEGFVRWAAGERVRLRRHYEGAAEALVRGHLARADWTAALALASQLAERFPALPVSSRLLIETLTLSGRGSEIRAILTELAVGRTNSTTAATSHRLDLLLDDVDQLARAGALARPQRPLIGRTAEFRMLLDAWTAARAAAGGAFLIDGPEGIGKSRFLANVALRLRLDSASMIVVPATRVSPRGDSDAVGTVLQRLAAALIHLPGALGVSPPSYVLLKQLGACAPESAVSADTTTVAQTIDAFVDGLRAVGEEAPVAMLLDDVDHTDETTFHILASITARLRNARVLIVFVSSASMASRIEVSARQRITLAPLDADELRLMLNAADTGVSDTTAEAIFARVAGIPGRLVPLLTEARSTPGTTALQQSRTTTPADGAPAFSVDHITRDEATARRWRPASILSGAATLTVIATLAIRSAGATTVQEVLTVLSWRGDTVHTTMLEIGDGRTRAATPKVRYQTRSEHWPLRRLPDRVAVAPDGQTMAVQLETDGRNTMDIVGVQRDSAFPLVTGARDDAMPTWSPDGSLLAFSTNRWSGTGNQGCDIGILDAVDETLWRLSEGPDCDIFPAWSPNGKGLAFLRQHRARGDSLSLCTAEALVDEPYCVGLDPIFSSQRMIGWQNARHVLMTASSRGTIGIYAIDIGTGAAQQLLSGLTLADAAVSPSREFVACWCSTTFEPPHAVTVLDLRGRRAPAEIDVPITAPFHQIAWHTTHIPVTGDRNALRADLAAMNQRVVAAARTRGATAATTSAGGMRGDSLFSDRASMRSTSPVVPGVIRDPHIPDITSLLAGLTHPASDRLLLDERFSTLDSTVWTAFGDPRPSAGETLGGLNPGGDGSYPSGAYTRQAYPARDGLVIEAVVRVPITLPYWQEISLSLESDAFTTSIRDWNHRTGTWSSPNPLQFFESSIKYPGREGVTRAGTFAVGSGGTVSLVHVPATIGDGHDVTIVLNIRPDAMMTVTVDGALVSTRRWAAPRDGLMHLFVTGHAVESSVRVRAVRIWSTGPR